MLTSESPGWAVGEPDLQIVLPFLLFFHLPHQLAPSIATAVESGVFPGVLHGPQACLVQGQVPDGLTRRVELQLFFFFFLRPQP